MHICFCSPEWPPATAANGIVSYTSAIRNHLLAQGHDVSVLSHSRLYRGDGESVPVTPDTGETGMFPALKRKMQDRFNRRRGDMPAVGRMVAAQVRSANRIKPIDILEMEESFGWSDMVERQTGVKVVTRLHGPHFLNPASHRTSGQQRSDAQRCQAEGRAVRSARALTSPTRAIMEATCAEYGRPSGRLDAVIPNPVTLRPQKDRWRLAECDRDQLLMVSRFDYRKGADTMLAAFMRLLDMRPSLRLTLVGPDMGIQDSSSRTLHFDEYVRRNLPPHVRDRIDYLGKLPPDRIMKLRQRAFASIVASRFETFCYSLVESYAVGCPVISTDWPGSAEVLAHGKTGLSTPVADPEALARNLDRLLAHPDMAASMAENGIRFCHDNFSVEKVGAQMLSLYDAARREPSA